MEIKNKTLEDYWSLNIVQILNSLNLSINGLSTSDAEKRLQLFGLNSLISSQKKSVIELLINQFKSPIILILIFATIISALVKEWVDAIIILFIIIGSSLLSFFQEYNASNATEALKKRISIRTKLLRDEKITQIPSEHVVPGDIILLSAGSLVPADCILLEANDLYVNQSVLTGETFPAEKTPGVVEASASLTQRTNCVFMGTSVRNGTAKALVINTGQNTEFGKISKTLNLKPEETEFEKGVRLFGLMLSEIMLVMVLLVFGFNVFVQKPILDSLLFSIALAVGLTPQLLPAIISINLSKGAQEMARHGVIVKRLNAIENFGAMDVLCTDKTGTLTQGTVELDGAYDLAGKRSESVNQLAYLNAVFQNGLANPIDEAIKSSREFDVSDFEKIKEIPYDFTRKRLSVVINNKNTLFMVTKGALGKILEVCSLAEVEGEDKILDQAIQQSIQEQFLKWSEKGYRVLGIAKKSIDDQAQITPGIEDQMVFSGFLLFYDPPKLDSADTINRLKKLGVSVKIITGDNKNVSRYIAESVGLHVPHILTGSEINNMQDEALWHMVEKVNLFVEVDPTQKERIIHALKKRNHVVGYMGDGINDAPSLHNADVGISVDQAVDVAKDAADFVLMKHDLSVLQKGIELGRSTFANTLKYINVTTSANFGNMFSMAGLSIFLPFLPLLPLQVLLTNFLTDLPAMMIANDFNDEGRIC